MDAGGGYIEFALIVATASCVPASIASLSYYLANDSAWHKAKLAQSWAQTATRTWAIAFSLFVFVYMFAITVEKTHSEITILLTVCSLVSVVLMYFTWKSPRGPLLMTCCTAALASITWYALKGTNTLQGEISLLYSIPTLLVCGILWNAVHAYALELALRDRIDR